MTKKGNYVYNTFQPNRLKISSENQFKWKALWGVTLSFSLLLYEFRMSQGKLVLL